MEKKYPPEQIESERIVLKKHFPEIAEMMFACLDHDRERLQKFLPWLDLTKTLADEESYIKTTLDKWQKQEMFDYGIYQKSDGRYLGNTGIHSISWAHERCEIGYWILGEFEGKGYVSETVRALERTFFELGFHRIEIRCSSRNQRSARVPMRCGYHLEGRLVDDGLELGERRSTLIFGKTRDRAISPIGCVGLDFVYLFTSDLKKSRDWYGKVFGLRPSVETEDFVEFRPGGHSGLCLHPADSKSPQNTGGNVGYWRVIDFNETVKHFESHGAQVYRGPLDLGNGDQICQLKDPIGSVIGVVGGRLS